MTLQLGNYLVFAGLLVFHLTDGSGQDARFFSRRGQFESGNGRFPEALKLNQLAYRIAAIASDPILQSQILNNIGGCQLGLFRYREAEQTLQRVRRSDEAAHDDILLGGADANLAALSAQMDDFPTAEMYARESLDAYSRTGQPKLRLRPLLTLATILSRQQSVKEGERYFLAGIRTATSIEDWTSAAYGWQHYGKALLENGQLEDANRALAESQRLSGKGRNMTGKDALLWNLSRLRLRQHHFADALKSINSAIQARDTGGLVPTWQLYQTRAQVELAKGDAVSALDDARKALERARALRANVIPDNDSRVGAEGFLDEAFSVLIDAGNQVYLNTRDTALLRETFEAAEENRADSLDKLLPTSSDWRAHLPSPQYWDKLSELIAQQRRTVRFDSALSSGRLVRLRSELSEMEAAAQSTVNARVGTVLDRVRKNLPADAALLSFRLGDGASWLWAVDRAGLRLYRLPPKAALLREIRNFRDGIHDNDTRRIGQTGRRLFADLFGGLKTSLRRSSQWFISADKPLSTVPMAALVVEVNHDGPVYLTQRKTLQLLPGAQLFDSPARGSLVNQRFVAVGDGIYNRADPRYGGSGLIRPSSWSMARLPASGAEVRFAANLWPNVALLTGSSMTKKALIQEIDRDPAVIHIASHVIPGHDRWQSGILALGMDRAGEPDLLTPQEILMHPLHSRLVVMTGCSSGSADSLPASGLMGLTRAWLAAGAGEVLATRWPTRDEDGDGLIGGFYLHLLASPDGNIPKALRKARQDMIARGGWRAEPRYWSSYFLIGVR